MTNPKFLGILILFLLILNYIKNVDGGQMMFKGFSKTNEKPEEIKNQEINENNEIENNEKIKKSVPKIKEKTNNDKGKYKIFKYKISEIWPAKLL